MLVWALFVAIVRGLSRPGGDAAPLPRHRLHRPVPRPARRHRHLPRRVRLPARGPARRARASSRVLARGPRAHARLRRLRRRGLPRRHREHPLEPDARARARSVSPTRETLRFVVVPQAVRRIIPPLLNDFIGLQKDTALVSASSACSTRSTGPRIVAVEPASTSRPSPAWPICFLVITIPLARRHRLPVKRDQQQMRANGMSMAVPRGRRGPQALRRQLGAARHRPVASNEHEVVCLIGAVRVRQVDAAALHQRLETIEGGEIRIDGDRVTGVGRRRRRRAPRGRHRVPELQPLPAHDRAREHHARAAARSSGYRKAYARGQAR